MAIVNAIKNYFVSAYHEISKVVWPTREEIIRYTILVIILSIIVAAFLGGLDYMFKGGIERILEPTNL